MEQKVNKYNPLWLTINNMDEDWHEKQSAYLKSKLDNIGNARIKTIATDIDTLEAYLSVLKGYKITIETKIVSPYGFYYELTIN